jgi:uncharacterized protein (DUF427 family)
MRKTATKARTRGRVRVESAAKRVRAYLGGETVADTTRPILVWEAPYYPTYYFPVDDVRTELLEADDGIAHPPVEATAAPSPSGRGEGGARRRPPLRGVADRGAPRCDPA